MADISQIKVLDGTVYDIKDSTARQTMTSAEATAGTSTSARMITPAILKEAIQAHSYWQYNATTDSIDLVFPS